MFDLTPPTRHMHRHRKQNIAWDHSYMYRSEVSPIPPTDTLPIGLFDTFKASTPTDLPSRVRALNRRANIVSATLAHLTTAVKPLETNKREELNDGHLRDIHYETQEVMGALEDFTGQMEEVRLMMQELCSGRRNVGPGWEMRSREREWARGKGLGF